MTIFMAHDKGNAALCSHIFTVLGGGAGGIECFIMSAPAFARVEGRRRYKRVSNCRFMVKKWR